MLKFRKTSAYFSSRSTSLNARGSAGECPALYRLIQAAFLAVFFLSFSAATAFCESRSRSIDARVRWVVDGDTVVIEGGEKVRYVGVDTPERGEPFYKEAKRRNITLVMGKKVRLVVCGEEPRDKYGRLLAFVYSDGLFVNRALVEEGLARRLIIPPCGLPVADEFKELERSARDRGLGMWGKALP